MPQLVVAIVAAAASYAAGSAATAALIAAGYSATTAAIIGAVAGAVVATAVGYGASALLGLNKTPKQDLRRSSEDRKQLIRSSIEPRQVVYGLARVSGPIVYASSSGDQQQHLHLVIPVAGHACDGLEAVWINGTRIPASSLDASGWVIDDRFTENAGTRFTDLQDDLRRLVRVRFYNGEQTAADPDLVAESVDGWSSAHVGYGVSYIYARLTYSPADFPQGLQNVSAEIRGNKEVYDPRTDARGYSSNAAMVILHYLRSDFGLACSNDEIDFDSFVAAANVCDEDVQIDAPGTTQKRNTINGAFSLDRPPIEIIDDMLAACGGTLTYVQGAYRLHVGAYEAPTDTLTISDLAGDVELITRPPRRELFNAVRGTFIDPDRSWQASEFYPYTDADYETEDGERIWRDIELPYVTDNPRAQRLAKMLLERARESLTVRAPVRYAGIRYRVWQTISVTLDDFGWSSKPFRIVSLSFDPVSGIVTLTLREESAASYAWVYDELADAPNAPDTTLVSPFTIPAPNGLAVSESLYVTANGAGVKTRATLTWAASAHPFVRGYDVQIREATATEWRTLPGTQGELQAVVDDIADGLYVWRVRARTTVAAGDWATVQKRIGGLAAEPPAAVTGLAVQSIGGLAFLRWDLHADLDVRVGGRIEFRHSPDDAGTWSGSTSIGEAVPGGATWTVLPLKAGTYLAKAVDAGGRHSATAATIRSTQATALSYANVDTLTEHPAFSGTGTDTVVVSSTLRLNSSGDMDSEADFDAIADLDTLGGLMPAGSYAFSGGMDLLMVKSVRLTAAIAAEVVNTYDQVDARAESIDEWLDFDGAVGGEADAWVEVRETNDDPAGAPTWSDWRRLDAAEFTARAFEFRAQLRSNDAAFNIHVAELSVTADEVS
jgi:hypothetical protein